MGEHFDKNMFPSMQIWLQLKASTYYFSISKPGKCICPALKCLQTLFNITSEAKQALNIESDPYVV